MKFYWRALVLLLALLLSLSVFVGCDQGDEVDTEEEETDEEAVGFFPDVEKKEYGLDFNVFAEGSSGPSYYLMDEEKNTGSPMDEAVFNRQGKVERYLGVDIVRIDYDYGSNYEGYIDPVRTAVQNMDGSLDAIITHVHGAVANLITDNLLLDFSELEGVDLDADYWNSAFMNKLELNGNYFLGLSDYNILNTYVIAFNKDMLALYESSLDKSIYDTVLDMEWTIDKMTEIASLVSIDATGDGKTTDDTYGISGICWVAFCGFLTSSAIPMFEQDQSGQYKVALNQSQYFEKADSLITKLRRLGSSSCAYFDYIDDGNYHDLDVQLKNGKALMQLASTSSLAGFLDYNVDFGVLPYPLFDVNQASVGYKTLQWGGYIGALSYMKNPVMTGEALEMLSYYSEPVKITFYEKLLGKQVADMPEDAAMFDIIWNGLDCDVGQAYVNVQGSGTGGQGLLYTVPLLLQPSATQNLASYVNGKESSANETFKKFINNLD